MRILRAVPLLGVTLCAFGWAQTEKPDVDWAAISQKLDALQSAVKARDIEKTKAATDSFSHAWFTEWQKQVPTPGDYLLKAETQAALIPASRTGSLPYLATLAFQAGDLQKAELYARETLQSPSHAWDSIHAGNTVLGLIALKYHDVAGARAYLLAAAKTNTTHMERFGPNLALAKALLDEGENDVVLEYLQLCKSFVTKNPKLDEWIATLKGGRAPDLSHEYLWFQ